MNPLGLESLRARLHAMERSNRALSSQSLTGWQPLDAILPGGGFRSSSLVEWLADGEGTPSWSLATLSLLAATRERAGPVVIFDPARRFYPLGLPTWGREWSRLLIVRGVARTEELWAWEQVLRSSAIRGTVGFIDKADDRHWRRLQLAAERGGTLAMILRPSRARWEPHWADVRLWVDSLPRPSPDPASGSFEDGGRTRWMRLEVLHARGGTPGRSIKALWDDETGSLSLAGGLVDSTTSRPALHA